MKLLTLLSLFTVFMAGCSMARLGQNYTHPFEPRYTDYSLSPTIDAQVDKIKIVSFNVKYARKIDAAIAILQSDALKNADIITLQEMDSDGIKKIAEALHYNYAYYPACVHPIAHGDFGNAILTKWPIINDQKIILPHLDPNKLQRIAVGATINVNNKKIMVFSVHMDVFLNSKQKHNQVSRLVHAIPPSIDHVIIAGDFNSFTELNLRGIKNALREENFEHITKNLGWTYKHWYFFNKHSSLDHIFIRGLKVLEAGKDINRSASDHLPIWATLTF